MKKNQVVILINVNNIHPKLVVIDIVIEIIIIVNIVEIVEDIHLHHLLMIVIMIETEVNL